MSAFGNGAFGASDDSTGLGTNGFEVSLNYITAVPDPNILTCSVQLKLIFKSLLKRDSITKEKGVSDFLEYLESHPDEINDDLVIISWVQLYAKLSIDTSKKVRQLSHQVQSGFVSTLGKRYMKYLRDTIGIWLSGCFDSDRIVSKACGTSIVDAFGGSEEKVNNLWKLFNEQLFNYCYQVFAYESKDSLSDERFVGKDESETKFLRVILATIQLLTKVLAVAKSGTNQAVKPEVEQLVGDILRLEKLPEFFESKDLSIKRSMYLLIKSLVVLSPEYIDSQVFKNYSKGMIKGLKLGSSKSPTNPVLYSYLISPILESLITVTTYNSEIWAVKKAYDRITELLSLGSCNSDTYYNYLFKLLDILPDSILPLNDYDKTLPFINSLEANVTKEKLPKFLSGAWSSYLQFSVKALKSLPDEKSSELFEKLTASLCRLFDNIRILNPEVLDSLVHAKGVIYDDDDLLSKINYEIINVLPSGPLDLSEYGLTIKYNDNFILNFLSVLIVSKSDILESFIENAVDSLEDESESAPFLAYSVINSAVKKDLIDYERQITSAFSKLPEKVSFESPEFIKVSFVLLNDFNRSKLNKDTQLLHDVINSLYLRLSSDDELVQELLHTVSRFKGFEISKCEDLNRYLHTKSSDGNNDREQSVESESGTSSADQSILFKFVTPEILSNIFNKGNCDMPGFIKNCRDHYQNDPFIRFVQTEKDGSQFIGYLLEHGNEADSEYVLSQLERNLKEDGNDVFRQIYFKSLKSYVVKNNKGFDTSEIAVSKLNKLSIPTIDKIVSEYYLSDSTVLSRVSSTISELPNVQLAISNPIGTSIYSFGVQDGEFIEKKDQMKELINEANFIFQLVKSFGNWSVYLTSLIDIIIISDCAVDYNFLKVESEDHQHTQDHEDQKSLEDSVLGLQSDAYSQLMSLFQDVSFEGELVEMYTENTVEVNSTIPSISVFSYLNSLYTGLETTPNLKFYTVRIFKGLLSNIIERQSLQSFNQLKVNFNKLLTKDPLKLNVLVSSSKKFLTVALYDRIRNGVAAELAAVKKSSDIITKGLSYLQILNSFLDFDFDYDIPSGYSPIAGQRFMMVLTNLQNWLTCDIAYDAEFVPVKVELMKFCDIFINKVYNILDLSALPSEFTAKVFEMDFKLLVDSLNYINSDMDIPLAYHSLKTFWLLSQYTDRVEEWKDEIDSIYDELIELFNVSAKQERNNNALVLVNDYVSRIFNKLIPLKKLRPSYESLYSLLDSKNTNTQRLATDILLKLIPEVQDELVIETTLKRKKINTEDEAKDEINIDEESDDAKIPAELIKNISLTLEDYIEFEEQYSINRYLFSWLLVLKHFKNITYRIRQDYISQIKEFENTDLFNEFLEFVIAQLDIVSGGDPELLRRLNSSGTEYIADFEIKDLDTMIDLESNKKLIVHLLYLALVELGSVVQSWFLSIRDKQLKMNVEKFIIKYMSPIIVDTEFSRLQEDEKSLSTEAEFTVKLNKLSNEIKCLYEIDEQNLEMDLSLPSNYPLSNIEVNGAKRLGVNDKKWKSWILSVQYVLNIQNGTIKDAIMSFENNVKLNFSGYEDCAICYSILHPTDHSIPNKICGTCSHNFHSACLYRWFKSSGSSTCPLCRNKFKFKRGHS